MTIDTLSPIRQRTWRTLWRHLWLDEHDAQRLLGAAGLARLTQRVRASEAHHLGEIRVCIEAALPLRHLLTGSTPRQRALALFKQLGVGRTTGRNGVLVYLLVADQAIEIVVDPALHAAIPPDHWQAVVALLQQHLTAGALEQGLLAALDRVDAVLTQHVPAGLPGGANPNELPDEPLLL